MNSTNVKKLFMGNCAFDKRHKMLGPIKTFYILFGSAAAFIKKAPQMRRKMVNAKDCRGQSVFPVRKDIEQRGSYKIVPKILLIMVLNGLFNAAMPVGASNNYMVSTGIGHTCTLDDNGVTCWGDNSYGQSTVPAGLVNPSQVSAGGHHTCAIVDNGVICWGNNANGQSSIPDGLVNPSQISAGGYNHTCALDDNGVICWGGGTTDTGDWPDYGQSIVPDILINPSQISAGGTHTCALDDNGVICWGDNDNGQSSVPDSLTNPRQVSAGWHHTCALDDNGVTCWGAENIVDANSVSFYDHGQATVPDVLVNPSFISAGSDETCALDDNGIICWGTNGFDMDSFSPTHGIIENSITDGLFNPRYVSVGSGHSCALDDNGMTCWGDNQYGEINVPDGLVFTNSDAEGDILAGLSIDGPDTILAGAVSTYSATVIYSSGRTNIITPDWELDADGASVDTNGRVWTDFSATGDMIQLTATYIAGEESVTANKQIEIQANLTAAVTPQLVATDEYNLVLLPDGRIKSWGKNYNGELGDGTRSNRSAATQVEHLTDVVFVMQDSSYAVKSDGTVWEWGGYAASVSPKQVVGLENVVYIAPVLGSLAEALYVVTSDGVLFVWDDENLTVVSGAPNNIVSISNSSGSRGGLFLTAEGNVWRRNSFSGEFSQLGSLNGIVEIIYNAAVITESLPSGWIQRIESTSFALTEDGTVWAWGDNSYGQLGNGTQMSSSRPAPIQGLDEIVSIAAGGVSIYAVDHNGSVWTWGRDGFDTLLTDDSLINLLPVQISGLSGIVNIAAVDDHVIALRQDGALWAWGYNHFGQLGNGVFGSNVGLEEPSLVVDGSLTGFLDLYPDVPNDTPSDVIPPFLMAGSTQGDNSSLTLEVEINLNDVFSDARMKEIRNRADYNVYVGALLPTEGSTAQDASQVIWFLLDSNNAWGPLSGFPLAKFMSNVEVDSADHRLMFSILTATDVRPFVGATVYVGYGTSDIEMLENRRYRSLFTVGEEAQ